MDYVLSSQCVSCVTEYLKLPTASLKVIKLLVLQWKHSVFCEVGTGILNAVCKNSRRPVANVEYSGYSFSSY